MGDRLDDGPALYPINYLLMEDFGPAAYPHVWDVDEMEIWIEQYLLEISLSNNRGWDGIGAIIRLHYPNYPNWRVVAPYLGQTADAGVR